ncbi:hypothetical protein ACFOLA_04130 [Salinicoccus hispanicus]|uniref:Uncharacterized protein n=1 Tax=Salinicoccus hispanicus TaxID=157225 RepID=A0A6N8U2Q1_9STAP|nr:hypothetical protein [Salinicoccus hispanicus]MXQ52003.1 hypothetical protein [Salinicoccus hispanicus]
MYRLIAMIATFILIYAGSYLIISVDEPYRLITGVVVGIIAVIPNVIVAARDRRKKRDTRELDEEIEAWSRSRSSGHIL